MAATPSKKRVLALEGLGPARKDWDLDAADIRREIEPMIALVNDVQGAMKREGE